MIVTLEGIDCCGKSWLADEIAREFMLTRFDNSFSPHAASYTDPESSWEDVVWGMNVVTGQAYDSFDNFVKDRFFMSEYVYAKYYKRRMNVSYDDLCARGADKNVLIFVDASYDVHVAIAEKKGEKPFTLDEYNEHRGLYYQALHNANVIRKFVVQNDSTAASMAHAAFKMIEMCIDKEMGKYIDKDRG